jgi:hypothetical protein
MMSENGFPKFKMSEWSMFERYVEFCNQYNPEILLMEQHLINKDLGYAGTIDRVMNLNGKSMLIDIKTSNSIYPSYWLQLAAYNELLQKEGIKTSSYGILWLNAKTRTEGKKGAIQGAGWQLVIKDSLDEEIALFNTTYTLWKALNKDIIPKKLSYKLTHKK